MFVKPYILGQLRMIPPFVGGIGAWLSATNMKIMSLASFPLISNFRIRRGPKGCESVLSYCIISKHRTTDAHDDIAGLYDNT